MPNRSMNTVRTTLAAALAQRAGQSREGPGVGGLTTMSTTRWLSVVATAAVFATAGCSDTDSTTGGDAQGDDSGGAASSVTRAEYAEQGTKICRENGAEVEEALGFRSAPSSLREGRRLVRRQVVPIIREGNQQMRELERPPADAAALEQLYDDMDTVLDGLMKDPDPFIVGPNPWAGVDPEFIRLGMDDCAG